MKGFIEIEIIRDGKRNNVLVALSNIIYVEKDSNGAADISFWCIERRKNRPWTALCIQSVETYDEVVSKIKEATE